MASPARIVESTPDAKSTEALIQRRAYELYMERGGEPGSELEDWLLAESEIREEAGLEPGI